MERNSRRQVLRALAALTLMVLPASAAASFEPYHSPYHSPYNTNGKVALAASYSGKWGSAKSFWGPAAPAGPKHRWIAGRWGTVEQRVWVPGASRSIWVAPVYQTRWDGCGQPYTVLIAPGHWELAERQGHYEVQLVRVWQPGSWVLALR